MMRRARLTIAAILAIAVPALLLCWLLLTQNGLQTAAALLERTSGGQLQLAQVSGRLADRMQIGKLRWTSTTDVVEATNITLHWTPWALMRGVLDISALHIAELDVTTKDSGEAPQLPETLVLPLAFNIGELTLGPLNVNGQLIADRGSAALSGDARAYVAKNMHMRRGDLHVTANGRLEPRLPYALEMGATLSGKIEEKPFSLVLAAGGDLQRSELDLRTQEAPFELALQAVLQPFSEPQLATFSASAKNLNLAALLGELPQTRISASCHMARNEPAADSGQAANCRLDNALAGPLDQGRLPVKQITARLGESEGKLRLSALRLGVGAGSLQGRAVWSAAGLHADLNAQALDLAAIHSRAQRSSLAGPLVFARDAGGMKLGLNLREDKLSIQAQLLGDDKTFTLERLQLNARGASFTAEGRMQTASGEFSLRGNFDRFDPAQFLRAPTGNLNGDFTATGRIDKTPQFDLSFALRDSRLANAPASGHGHVDLAWPHLRRADVRLDLGPNRARLAGAFGGAGERLRLDIDAPALGPYGLEGDLQAHLEVGGRLDTPLLNGHVRSISLRLPGYGRIQKLALDAAMGSGAEAPLNLRVLLDRLDLASRANAVRKLDFDLHGSRRQHQLTLSAQLGQDLPLRLAARGGFTGKDARDWHGSLTQLTLDQPGSQRFLHLDGEAALAFAPQRWSLGPALLQSRNAAIKLNASAAPGKLQATLAADNPSIGHVGLDIAAQPAHAWALSAHTRWQGRLQATIGDLAWVNDLLGAPWQASGSLNADVRIAGTPQFPALNGQISGSGLGLRHLDTRMHLHNGSLLANIRDSVLSLDEFSMQSVLTTPPPTLQRMLDDRGRSLIATPGRISAKGRMKLGGMGSGDADELHLDVDVDRLGVSQTPRQWLLLSGQSQLNWQQAKLGVQAKLNVDAAHWQLADLSRPQLSDDVIVRREGSANSEARRITPWAGTVQIGLGRHFSFEGAGARGRLAGQVQIIASAQDLPRASGTVNLVNGRYEAYGQQLDIERGILNFQGLLENPALNILALRKGLPVEAGVEITGFAQAPQIRLVSEPNVPDAEKLSWLVLGRPPTQEGSDTGVLMAAVGAIFGNQSGAASQQIKDSFGIDEISVRSGTPGQLQAMNSRVVSMSRSSASTSQVFAVGKQLSNRLRLSYEQAIGGVDSLVRLTFKVTDKISVVGTSGTDAALDVFYTFSFGGKPAAPPQP